MSTLEEFCCRALNREDTNINDLTYLHGDIVTPKFVEQVAEQLSPLTFHEDLGTIFTVLFSDRPCEGAYVAIVMIFSQKLDEQLRQHTNWYKRPMLVRRLMETLQEHNFDLNHFEPVPIPRFCAIL